MSITFTDDPIRAAADAVLSGMGMQVYFGNVTDADASANTISAPLPYLLRGLVLPFDTNQRVNGRGTFVHQFTLQYVHRTDAACLNIVNGVRDYLDGYALTADGREYRIRLSDPSPITIMRDDTWVQPSGDPLFYASDRYSVL